MGPFNSDVTEPVEIINMDDKDFFIETMDVIEFLANKGHNALCSINYDDPSNLTWKQVITLMSEYYDT